MLILKLSSLNLTNLLDCYSSGFTYNITYPLEICWFHFQWNETEANVCKRSSNLAQICLVDEIDALWLSRAAQAQSSTSTLTHPEERQSLSSSLSSCFSFVSKKLPVLWELSKKTIWKWRRRWWNLTTGGRNVSAAQVLDLAQSSSAPLTLFFPPLPSSSLLWLWWMRRYFSCSSEYERSGFDFDARWSQN